MMNNFSVFYFIIIANIFLVFSACNRNARCLNDGERIDGECICNQIYTGDYCEQCACKNNGLCNDQTKSCECPPVFGGALCQTCKCQNGGECSENGQSCNCPEGFSGQFCEIDNRPECQKNKVGELTVHDKNPVNNNREIWIDNQPTGITLHAYESYTFELKAGKVYTVMWKGYFPWGGQFVACTQSIGVIECNTVSVSCGN